MGAFCSHTVCNSSELDFIHRNVSSDCVVIFSKTDCPHSQAAKKIFDDMKTGYKVIELDKRGDGPSIQTALGQLTGQTTVPRVFINGQFVGGASETKLLRCSGRLSEFVSSCRLHPSSSASSSSSSSKADGPAAAARCSRD